MAVKSKSEGILGKDQSGKRDHIVEMLSKAYWMEIETVMSYIANSVNPDGVSAQEIKESLQQDITEELGQPSCSRSGSRSSTASCPARRSSAPSRATCSRRTSRRTSCTSSGA